MGCIYTYKGKEYSREEIVHLLASNNIDELNSNFNLELENASKVVDENGEPLVVYHGTKDNFNEFDSKKQSNKGFWFTPKKNLADGYSMARNSGEIGNVFSVFLNIKNPANNDWVSKSNPNSEIITNDMVSFDELGYDGWISVIGGKTTSLVALNPNQIKSATSNIGTYSASSNDIRYSLENIENINVVENDYIESELFKDISSIPFITKEQSLGVYKSIYTNDLNYWENSDVKC